MRRFSRVAIASSVCVLIFCLVGVYFILRVSGKNDQELVVSDWGDLPPGTMVSRPISIPNPTSRPHTIKRITKDCACVVEQGDCQSIPAKQTVRLDIQLKLPSLQESIQHWLQVFYEQTQESTLVLITGTVAGWVEIDRPTIDFSEVVAGSTAQQILNVKVKKPWPARKRSVRLELEHGKVIAEEPGENGKSVKYRLEFSPKADAQPGECRGELTLRWTGQHDKLVRVPCAGKVVSRWSLDPDQVFFGVVPKGSKRQIDFRVHDRKGSPESVLWRATITHNLNPCFEVRSRRVSPDSLEVAVALTTSKETPTGLLGGKIDIPRPGQCGFPQRNGAPFVQ